MHSSYAIIRLLSIRPLRVRTFLCSHARLPMKLYFIASEQSVNLFECEVPGLRVEKVDEREEGKVEDAKVDISTPTNV